MKYRYGAIILEEQERYLEALLPARDALAQEMERYSALHKVPSSDREVLAFLEVAIRSIGARNILELGTAIGYGSIGMARALELGGRVTTIDPDEERIEIARGFIQKANLEDRIVIIRGTALEVLPTLTGPFDLAYIDAIKEEYSDYLDALLPLMRTGGVIIADNVLWKGQVATGRLLDGFTPESTEALQQFNHKFMTHPDLRSIIIPFGDGIAYGVKL